MLFTDTLDGLLIGLAIVAVLGGLMFYAVWE